MAGVVHIPWYATVFRGDKLAAAITEVSAYSLRYGATQYRVHRSLDDAYKITQMLWFDSKLDWERYWEGPEMQALRTRCSSWYQVPVAYVWHEEIAADAVAADAGPVPAEAQSSI
jgi:hypothetical protein